METMFIAHCTVALVIFIIAVQSQQQIVLSTEITFNNNIIIQWINL